MDYANALINFLSDGISGIVFVNFSTLRQSCAYLGLAGVTAFGIALWRQGKMACITLFNYLVHNWLFIFKEIENRSRNEHPGVKYFTDFNPVTILLKVQPGRRGRQGKKALVRFM